MKPTPEACQIKRGANGNKINDGEVEKETQVCYKVQEPLSSVWKAKGIP